MNNTRAYLQKALTCAQKRRGFCAPNPSVGALIVKDNHIISQGIHQACGADHAEVAAIKTALQQTSADTLKEATLYLTLEPCCHQGKTPPCTDFIIQHSLKRVIYAEGDPNPKVNGQGAEKLRQAGIDCQQVKLDAISDFYRSYRYWWKTQRPWVTAKLAMSLDGKTAQEPGKPTTLTSETLQHYTHTCRKQADAILTTASTIIADNPQLNVRFNLSGDDNDTLPIKKPIYILDSQLKTPLSAQIFTTADPVTLFHYPNLPDKRIQTYLEHHPNTRCVAMTQTNHDKTNHCLNPRLNLREVIQKIGQDGIHDLWVEAGGRCFQALIDGHHVQRALLYVAPKWLGPKALSAFSTSPSCFNPTYNPPNTLSHQHWFSVGEEAVLEINFEENRRSATRDE